MTLDFERGAFIDVKNGTRGILRYMLPLALLLPASWGLGPQNRCQPSRLADSWKGASRLRHGG